MGFNSGFKGLMKKLTVILSLERSAAHRRYTEPGIMEIVCDARLSAVGVKISVVWDITSCTLLKSSRRWEAPAASSYHFVSLKHTAPHS